MKKTNLKYKTIGIGIFQYLDYLLLFKIIISRTSLLKKVITKLLNQ